MPARLFCRAALALSVLLVAGAASAAEVADRIGVPGPLNVGGRDYVLAASTQPAPNIVRQDYIPSWQTLKSWRDMVTVEVTSGANVASVVEAHEDALKQKRAGGTPVHMRTWRTDKGEALIDVRIDGRNLFGFGSAEWSATRYAPVPNGVMRFALTRRATENARDFLADLGHSTPRAVDAVATYALPSVTVTRPKAGG